ncbi:MAG: hypothetical protein A3D87_08395 [Omnitrophica WOR_2 bacterium RIFCSPHIGHO2_02_FULL_50_17]|nr:MAG: hypothetical protein A3D87_08395 [Omnitrophica WOR_2 bacterium RIFCSPHIGHO2_02_FULL_50_17]
MTASILVFTALLFSTLYPLRFWFRFKTPFKNDSFKFHLALPNVVGGITLVCLLFMEIPFSLKMLAVFWKAVFLVVSQYCWKKGSPNPFLLTIPSFIGLYLCVRLQAFFIGHDLRLSFAGVLGGFIFCLALFIISQRRHG